MGPQQGSGRPAADAWALCEQLQGRQMQVFPQPHHFPCPTLLQLGRPVNEAAVGTAGLVGRLVAGQHNL